ncbi:MAG: hypothetical protein J0M11_07085 [Anaerolineae bacterium]|nr:hypothetical protein [Anaerolineae bacterium]MBN8655481.1 hypothetical protein [Anaerolineae bacterium]
MRSIFSRFRGFIGSLRLIRLFIAASFLIAFWVDFTLAIKGYWNLFIKFLPPTPETSAAMLKVTTGLMLLIAIYVVFMFWLTHFVLPITHWEQSLPGFWRMFLHGISWGRLHGPAVFVRNGEVQGERAEFRKKHPGVAFLDLRSAMTLDKLHHSEDEDLSDSETNIPPKVRFSLVQSGAAYAAKVRTVGPGLVFTDKHETITGAVDLRTQVRTRKVIADTRDGIRVSTSVTAVFTVGQLPDVLDVYLGGENMDQVFVIEWDKTAPAHTKRISKLFQDLSPEDEAQVKAFASATIRHTSFNSDLPSKKDPFTFDEKRVQQAVYSIANRNDPDTTGVKKWSDWPADVAAEHFRILLSEYPYLSLYEEPSKEKDSPPTPMKELKRRYLAAVRNTGVLAFQLVRQINGLPPQVGVTYPEDQLVFFPPQTFKGPAVLRGRGIKVINVSFGELEPEDKRVMKNLRESWLSAKKKEESLKVADSKLEATRIINHARIRTQQNMNYHLARLLEKQEYPREALAMLVFQELEAAAANPETRKLLPENTLNMMNTIGQLLLQSQREEDGIGNERTFIPPEEEE